MCYNHIYLFRSLFFCKDFFHKAELLWFATLSANGKSSHRLSREASLPRTNRVKFSVIREVPF